ncbi:hypothetical protein BGX20_006912, partial [Mortierella sp. AD010]
MRVINCYIPSDTTVYRDEIPAIENWIQKEYRDAQQDSIGVILMGDFNGVMNPQVDRSRVTGRSTAPETELLRWL